MLGVLGHAAIDTIRRGLRAWKSPGGAPTYCSFYLKQIGIEVKPLSLVGTDFSEYLGEYVRRGVPIDGIRIACDHTTAYEITYLDYGSRRLRLVSRCREFARDDLNDLPRVIAVNPIAREVSLDLLEYIKSRVEFLGVDVQGFTRIFDEDGYVRTVADNEVMHVILSNANVVKVSVDDAQLQEVISLADGFRDKVIVVTMGARGSLLIHNGGVMRVATDGIVDARDPTGAGDVMTCAMTYLLGRGEDLVWSFIYSNAIAVAKTMGEGPWGTIDRALVESIADKLYQRLVRS